MHPASAALLRPGESACILRITHAPLARRLFDMGISPGCSLQLLLAVPGGDPLVFYTSACVIALRKCECRHILLCP